MGGKTTVNFADNREQTAIAIRPGSNTPRLALLEVIALDERSLVI
jgi:hypothetical protein